MIEEFHSFAEDSFERDQEWESDFCEKCEMTHENWMNCNQVVWKRSGKEYKENLEPGIYEINGEMVEIKKWRRE